MALITDEIRDYISETIQEFYDIGPSLGRIIKKTVKKNVQLIDSSIAWQGGDSITKSIDRVISYFKADIEPFFKYDIEDLKLPEDECRPILDEVYLMLCKKMEQYATKIPIVDKSLIIREAIKDSRRVIEENYEKSETTLKLSAIMNHVVTIAIEKYLMYCEQIYLSKSKIEDEWHRYLFEQYCGSYNEPGTLEYEIIEHFTGDNLKKKLLESISLPEEDNLIFKGYDEWLEKNYENLVIGFYKWKENRENFIPSFSGLVTASILDLLNAPIGDKIISRDRFSRIATEMIKFFVNDNIKEIFSNYTGKDYYNYVILLKTSISYYLEYSKTKTPDAEVLNQFSANITTLFLNQCKKALTWKTRRFEQESGDYMTTYAKWLKLISDKLMTRLRKGVSDSFFNHITTQEIDEFFEVDPNKINTIADLHTIRSSYGKLEGIIGEILRRRAQAHGIIDEEDVEKMVENFIKTRWKKYLEEKQ